MKFNLNDFMQLDTKALLAVNGGTHCGGESSYPCGGSSGSSSYGARGGGGGSGGGHSHGENGSSGGGSCSGSGRTNCAYSPFKFDTEHSSKNDEGISIPTEIGIGNGGRIGGGQNGLTADLPINDTTSLTAGIGLGTATIG